MKLKILVDNNTRIDHYYCGEPGLSFYIEEEDKKILFDTGYSNIFLSNAKLLNVDLSKINYLVLSHGHNDHTGGLRFLKDKDLSFVNLIAHPGVFESKCHNGIDISCPVKLEELKVKKYFDGTNIINITDKLVFLGQIERTTSFEKNPVGFKTATMEPDYLQDDSAMVYKAKDGLFIITACSHSGICNIIEYAKKVCKQEKIIGVLGGFHLLKNDEQLLKTVEYLGKQNIDNLYPCHCVSLYAKHKMYETCNVHEVGVGQEFNII